MSARVWNAVGEGVVSGVLFGVLIAMARRDPDGAIPWALVVTAGVAFGAVMIVLNYLLYPRLQRSLEKARRNRLRARRRTRR